MLVLAVSHNTGDPTPHLQAEAARAADLSVREQNPAPTVPLTLAAPPQAVETQGAVLH